MDKYTRVCLESLLGEIETMILPHVGSWQRQMIETGLKFMYRAMGYNYEPKTTVILEQSTGAKAQP